MCLIFVDLATFVNPCSPRRALLHAQRAATKKATNLSPPALQNARHTSRERASRARRFAS
jgi:hypothetical protein